MNEVKKDVQKKKLWQTQKNMAKWSEESLKRFQSLLERDPHSPVFAPLADAYLDLGMLEEAERTARRGLQHNPKLASGEVILGKILLQRKKREEATLHLEAASRLDPTNVQSHLLLGQIHSENQEPKKALKAYKMVLFYNPHFDKIQRIVEKLESLTADEYEEETFSSASLETLRGEIKKEAALMQAEADRAKAQKISAGPAISAPVPRAPIVNPAPPAQLQRVLTLIDALIVRNDWSKAQLLLEDASSAFGRHEEIAERLEILASRLQPVDEDIQILEEHSTTPSPLLDRVSAARQEKIRRLNLLRRKAKELADPHNSL